MNDEEEKKSTYERRFMAGLHECIGYYELLSKLFTSRCNMLREQLEINREHMIVGIPVGHLRDGILTGIEYSELAEYARSAAEKYQIEVYALRAGEPYAPEHGRDMALGAHYPDMDCLERIVKAYELLRGQTRKRHQELFDTIRFVGREEFDQILAECGK